jgi:hypothetical protein
MISEKEVACSAAINILASLLILSYPGQNQRDDVYHGFSPQVLLARLAALCSRVCPSYDRADHRCRSIYVLAHCFGGVLCVYCHWIPACRHHILLHVVQHVQQSDIWFVRRAQLFICAMTTNLQVQCLCLCSRLLAPSSTLEFL